MNCSLFTSTKAGSEVSVLINGEIMGIFKRVICFYHYIGIYLLLLAGEKELS